MQRNERHQKMIQYNFKCSCHACEIDYPLYNDLPVPITVPNIITDELMIELFNYDYNLAKKMKEEFCEYLQKYDKFYPCQQICAVQEGLKLCFNTLLKNLPLRIKHQ